MSARVPKFVALCGRARVGKDTAAAILAKEFGYERVALGDIMKRMIAALCAPSGAETIADEMKPLFSSVTCMTYARGMQVFGQGLRELFGQTIWFDALYYRKLDALLCDPSKRVVLTDLREPADAARVHSLGGVIVRLRRTGAVLTDGRLPRVEDAVDAIEADCEIDNCGTVEELAEKLRGALIGK